MALLGVAPNKHTISQNGLKGLEDEGLASWVAGWLGGRVAGWLGGWLAG